MQQYYVEFLDKHNFLLVYFVSKFISETKFNNTSRNTLIRPTIVQQTN